MIEYLQKGGPLVWILLACSIVSVAAILERWTTYRKATISVEDLLRGLQILLRQKRWEEAAEEAASAPGPAARVIHAVLLRADAPNSELREIARDAGQLEVPRLEKGLVTIVAIALLSPMLGLLGTVLGLADAFTAMAGQGGYTSSTEISKGVYQSLLATATGLVVSIPTTLAYILLSSRLNRLLGDIERAGIGAVNLVADARPEAAPSQILDFSAGAPARGAAGR